MGSDPINFGESRRVLWKWDPTPLLVIGLAALMLSGCGGLISREALPERISYLIDLPADSLDGESETRCQVLRLNTISAAIGQLGSGMLYKESPQRLDAFAYTSWLDAPVDMIEPQLRRALNESGLFKAVIPAASPVLSDLSLTISELSLLMDLSNSDSQVRLDADLELANPDARELIDAGRISISETSNATPADGARAANRAVERFANEILTFLRNATEATDGCE